MIVMIGATGTIGSALLKSLVNLGIPVRAISRDPEKLRIKIGDLDQSLVEIKSADAAEPESLRRAFTGASQLFLAMSNSPRQVELETTIIRIAAEIGIEHIVKVSSPAFNPKSPVAVASWHHEIEKTLAESNITHTVLRPYAFMQNILRFAPAIKTQDVFCGSMGDTACNFVDCRDIADVAVEVLTNSRVAGKIYTLTGAAVFSYPQIARKLSILLGRSINYINMNPQVLRRNLIEHEHMPHWLADHVLEIQTMSVMLPERPMGTVKQLLGREPRTLDDFLCENLEVFR
ncbi:NmrA family NAD(P)-binding protein [Bacillus sp. BP-3]|uniref:NmrA family NAD(P)-binding protein n=1 Tax=Bacillus sp. BP-3 TaxID=3022773 RepID=UPI00232CF900|nr:NmrA family NAD(P)-binding protein [Bacillus sp. BP-3]MDC2864444.1 NmrA family NAD(P)-binding protein [Bacillus sp. BP-3]